MVWEGNLSPAQDVYQLAITIARNNKLISEEADALDSLAQLRIIEGDLASSEKICQQVDSLSAAIKTTSMERGTWRSYYSVLVETGRFAHAESLANAGVQQSVKDQSVLHQAIAEDFLARALLAQGKSVAARDAVARATASSEKSKNLHIRLTSAITRARISVALGEFASPEKELANVLDQAKKAGFFDVQLDATMAVADLQQKRGEKNRARRLLTALEGDAKTHGFKLVAAQAKQKRSQI